MCHTPLIYLLKQLLKQVLFVVLKLNDLMKFGFRNIHKIKIFRFFYNFMKDTNNADYS